MEVVRSPKAISGDAQYSFEVVDGEEANFNFLIVVRKLGRFIKKRWI